MKRILIESERNNIAVESAQIGQKCILTTMGADVRLRYLWEITEEDLNWCDVYLSIRPFAPGSVELGKRIKAAGGFFVVYFDDDLLRTREGVWKRRFQYARECVELADVVIGCNPVLMHEYADLTISGRYSVCDYIIGAQDIIPPREEDGLVKFVYAAGKDHTHFFDSYIKPIMNRFMAKYGDVVEFTFMGIEPDLTDIERKDRVRLIPLMPLDKYRVFMEENRFDVGLAPLDNTPFCNRKYFNKYFEYGRVGIVGLYSDCLPYTLVIRDGENGILVGHESEDWYHALCTVTENCQLRRKAVSCVQQELRENYSLEKIAKKMQEEIPEYLTHEKSGSVEFNASAFGLKHKCFVAADRVFLVLYRLKTVGFQNTWKQIFSRIKNNMKRGIEA